MPTPVPCTGENCHAPVAMLEQNAIVIRARHHSEFHNVRLAISELVAAMFRKDLIDPREFRRLQQVMSAVGETETR